MRLKKSKYLLGIVVFAMSLFVGCASNDSMNEADYDWGASDSITETAESEPIMEEEYFDEEGANQEALENRKVIETRYISMETLEFDATTNEVESLVREYLGYIEESNVSGVEMFNNSSYYTRNAYYTLRVPSESFGQFVSDIKSLGNVIGNNVMIEDVTLQYVDVEARIESLEVQEDRLLELLEESANLEDIILLENKLSEVRYEIETKKATIAQLDNQISYGTLHLDMREVVEITVIEEDPKTFGEKVASGFTNSIKNIGTFFVNFAIFLITALPYLIVYGIIVFIIIWIIRWLVIRSAEKKEKKNINKNQMNNNNTNNKQ